MLYLGHRFIATGDFNGDGTIDTLGEHLVDRRTGMEAFKYIGNEDHESRSLRLAKERPLCFIGSSDRRIDSIPLALEYPASGIAWMRNEGDLDGNGTDELSYVLDHLDMSSVNSCKVVTLTRKGWREVLDFPIREWQIPQLPEEAKVYGLLGLQQSHYHQRDDSITSIISSQLDTFSFITPVSPGVVRVSTFALEDSDSIAAGESVVRLMRLKSE